MFDVLRGAYRRRRYRIHDSAWGLAIGTLAVYQFVLFLAVPETLQATSVAKALGPVADLVWAAWYALAGGCIVYGLLKPDTGIDALGLGLLAAATASQIVCIAAVNPMGLGLVGPQLFAPMVASVLRYRVVTGKVMPGPDDITDTR